jgi:hypothetical protein
VLAEALTILGTMAADLFFNLWDLEVLPECLVRFIPRCAISQKITGWSSDEVIEYFQFFLPFEPHYGPGVDSASNRNEYQQVFLGSRTRSARKSDLIAVCKPAVNIWHLTTL